MSPLGFAEISAVQGLKCSLSAAINQANHHPTMHSLNPVKWIFHMLLGVSAVTSLPAATYYVSTSGNDANTPAQAQNIATPWRTIHKAAQTMVAGDICNIRGGTYRETATVANNGTSISPITFQAYGTEVVTISGADAVTAAWTLESANVWYVPMSGILHEMWTGVPGTAVSSIPVTSAPSSIASLTSMEIPQNTGDNYGTRLSGVFTAPQAGAYTFWIASDDASQLWLSTNGLAANKSLIASVSGYTGYRVWTTYTTQKSVAVTLALGQKVYIEALQKEGTGGDHLSVGWSRPGQSTAAPSEIMPGSVFNTLGDGNQIFQSAVMKPEARWPNAGPTYPWQNSQLAHPTYNELGDWSYVNSAFYTNTHDFGGTVGVQYVSSFVDAQLPTRANGYWNGARVHSMSGDGWVMRTPSVISYTDSTKTIVTDDTQVSSTGAYTIKGGNEFYLTGKKSELDSAGEWFHDASASRLYFYSVAAPTNVEMKKRSYGMNLSGRSFIKLTNLDFFACTVQTSGAPTQTVDCTFDGLYIKYPAYNRMPGGLDGLALGPRCVLRNSEVAFASSSLILVRGNDVRIINNYLHDMCYHPTFAEGIRGSDYGGDLNATNRLLISHNTFHGAGRGIIGYPGRSSIIQYNDLYDGMKMATDGALMYWAKDGANGTIRYNRIHDSHGAVGHSGAGLRGIYWDNQNSGWIAHHNVIWNLTGYAMQINAPASCDMIFNNTFWNCSSGSILNSFWGDGPTGINIFNNILNAYPTGAMAQWNLSDIRYNDYAPSSGWFSNAAAGNFALTASATSAINRGTPIPGVTDVSPGSSVGVPDLGAMESGGIDWTSQTGYHATPPSPDPAYAAPSVPYGNKVVDGGFESGNLSPNWTKSAGSNFGLIISNAWVDKRLHSSYYGLQFGGRADGLPSELSQVVTGLLANKRYSFFATVQKTDPGAVVKVGVRTYGYADVEVIVPTTGTWGLNSPTAVPTIIEVPFITGVSSTSATVYVKVTRASGSLLVSATNPANPAHPTTNPPTLVTTAPTAVNISNYNSSTLVDPLYPATGVYVDDLFVQQFSHPDADPVCPMPAFALPFNETSGGTTAYDSTTNGRNGTITGGATWTAGVAGNALSFDSVDDQVSVAAPSIPATPFGSFTVCTWVKFDGTSTKQYSSLLRSSSSDWAQPGWIIKVGRTAPATDFWMTFYMWKSTTETIGSSLGTVAPGQWIHLATAVDRDPTTGTGTIKSYVNGAVISTVAIPAGFTGVNTGLATRVGAPDFKGQLDDSRVYASALTSAQIMAIKNADLTRDLHFELDDAAGSAKAWDATGKGKNGVLTNMNTATAWTGETLTFDGVNDSVVAPSSIPTTVYASFSVAGWVNFDGTSTAQYTSLARSSTTDWGQHGWILKAGRTAPATNFWVSFYMWDSTPPVPPALPPGASASCGTIAPGTWAHVATVVDRNPTTGAGTVKGYLNGALIGTGTLPAGMAGVNTGINTRIGAPDFKGQLDDMRTYNRALQSSEILDLVHPQDGPPY
jgi:hypothetical protein